MKKIFISVLLVATICIYKPNTATAQVNVQDSLALVDLYNSTNGSHWYDNNNWLTTAPVSHWYGILVSNNRVIQVDLYYNGVTGIIPASLRNLINLKALILFGNQLSGSIPPELGNLTHLDELWLNGNQLSGSIPSSLGNLTHLHELRLDGNQLSGSIPPELGNLINLKDLNLSFNDLSGSIPPELGNLINLRGLVLGDNQLSGSIPSSLGNFIRLEDLLLNRNQLSGSIPPELGNLRELHSLYLNQNQLSGSIPPELGNLKRLHYLYLDLNQLSGSIPSQLGNLHRLVNIYLDHNQLSDTIPTLIPFTVERLYLDHNKFTFAGMGRIARTFFRAVVIYSPQAIIPLHNNNDTLSVSVGSIPYHNTYNWYKDGVLHKTKVGDSTFHPKVSGAYYVTVTNSVATALTLYSDTVYITDEDLIAAQASELNISNKISSLNIYPNPAKTNATLSFNADGKYSITVTNVSGKILQTKTGVAIKGSNIIQLDVSKYASGIYLITITDEKNRRQTVRLSKE